MDAATIARVQEAFWWTLGVGCLFGLYFYLSQPAYDGGPTRWTRWKAALEAWRVSRVSEGEDIPSVELPAQTDRQTTQTDEQAPRLSGHDRLWREFLLDRKRARMIAVMLDSEIPVAEIRGLLKGDNNAISQEVAEARKYLGLTPPEEYRTPIANRPTQAPFQESDPDLVRQPLP